MSQGKRTQGGGIWEVTDPTSKWTVVQELAGYLRQGKVGVGRKGKGKEEIRED